MPDEALEAKKAFIFKRGDSTKMENYRPISLLSSIYKIMAAVLVNRIQAPQRQTYPRITVRF